MASLRREGHRDRHGTTPPGVHRTTGGNGFSVTGITTTYGNCYESWEFQAAEAAATAWAFTFAGACGAEAGFADKPSRTCARSEMAWRNLAPVTLCSSATRADSRRSPRFSLALCFS